MCVEHVLQVSPNPDCKRKRSLIQVRPKKGDAILFYSMRATGVMKGEVGGSWQGRS